MGSGKALIGGMDKGKGRIYPPDWPCVLCSRTFSKHVVLQEITDMRYWCFAEKEPEYNDAAFQWFKPIDNLTYVEQKANGKLPK